MHISLTYSMCYNFYTTYYIPYSSNQHHTHHHLHYLLHTVLPYLGISCEHMLAWISPFHQTSPCHDTPHTCHNLVVDTPKGQGDIHYDKRKEQGDTQYDKTVIIIGHTTIQAKYSTSQIPHLFLLAGAAALSSIWFLKNSSKMFLTSGVVVACNNSDLQWS